MKVEDIRSEYDRGGLRRRDCARSPLEQFEAWFEEALAAELKEPTAMTLATATAQGRPSARTVLLKGFGEAGFDFYTNYESRKGRELDDNPWAALLFYWPPLERQVRIEGAVQRLSREASDAYFQSRPRGSRVGAWASAQSRVLASRGELEAETAAVEGRYESAAIPLPPFWGGYRLSPESFEFWQGRLSRLHDRLCYHRSESEDDIWLLERLAP